MSAAVSRTSRPPALAEHHKAGLVRPGRRTRSTILLLASSPPDANGLGARDYRALVAPVALTTAAAQSQRPSPRPSPCGRSGQSKPLCLIADLAPGIPRSHSPFKSRPLGGWGIRDRDTVLADSPSSPPFHAPYSDRTFRPASSRCSGIPHENLTLFDPGGSDADGCRCRAAPSSSQPVVTQPRPPPPLSHDPQPSVTPP